ncbi:hypothetical protein ACJIZ3_015650 [Penstemon smallii]|uniref:DUF7870 domain-containing protein n=1 Tax=Penstemon smallii TaxID=265156 RepID=A0ABD3RN34_9LAMI
MDKMSVHGYRAKKNVSGYDVNEMNYNTLLIIKLPDSRVLRILSRSLFLAMFLLALPSIGSMMGGLAPQSAADYELDPNSDAFKILPILLRDLLDEGLIKKGHKGFVHVGLEINEDFEFVKAAGIDLAIGDMKVVAHEVFDFVFVPNFEGIQVVDKILKDGSGIVISPLGNDPLNQLRNYKIVYLRRFENTVVAMRKIAGAKAKNSEEEQVLCGATSEEKKAALKGLEDVYLEPPRRATLTKKSRKIKFLPDLLKDSLDEYPRRVFISDDSNALDWFYKNYPTRDQEFQVYDVEVVAKDDNEGTSRETDLSTWLMKHVRREDYVVMKAEAHVVEEMLKDKTLCLVDELFLECKNQWQDDEGEESGNRRAYWQCLALYGKVKDEGIAVHQWWN